MRFLSALLISTLTIVPSISASLLGTGNVAYYNPAPTFRLATTSAGSDALNTYSFMAINNIPADGSILVMIDKEYQQSNIIAGTDCIATATGFAPSDKSKGFSCTNNQGILNIKGFAWIPGAQIVTFTIKGIVNIRPSTVTHRAAQTQIRTIDGTGQLIDWSDMLTSLPFLSCTAAGADCSTGTGIPGVYSQLQACMRNNVQVQYCCPQGSHWTGAQYCSFDQVNLNIDPTKIYGTFSSHPGAPAPGNATFGPITPNSPFVVSTIQQSAYRYGGDFFMQYPSPATGAIIYPTFQFRYYREDGTLITSSNPTQMTQFDMQGYAAVPGGMDSEYGFLNFDDTNPWTAWLAQQGDFPVGTKVRYNVKIVAHADRTQTIPIPVAANSIDVWFMRI